MSTRSLSAQKYAGCVRVMYKDIEIVASTLVVVTFSGRNGSLFKFHFFNRTHNDTYIIYIWLLVSNAIFTPKVGLQVLL